MQEAQSKLNALLARARLVWRLRTLRRGVLLGLAAAGALVLLLAAAAGSGILGPVGQGVLRWAPPVALVLVPLGGLMVALLGAPSRRELALRAGEVSPEVGHLFAVLLELPPDHPYGGALAHEGRERLSATDPSSLAGPPARTPEWAASLGIAVVAAAVILGAGGPAAVWAEWGAGAGPDGSLAHAPDTREGVGEASLEPVDLLSELMLEVVPPSYTGLDAVEISLNGEIEAGAPGAVPASARPETGPAATLAGGTVSALAGSRLRLSLPDGRDASSLEVRLLRSDGDGETPAGEPGTLATWTLLEAHRGIVVSEGRGGGGGGDERIIPLEAVPDVPPRVELLEPDRDLVLARGTGQVTFRARARDPYGIRDFQLGWIHTRGGGESFDFREEAREWTDVVVTGDGIEGTLVLDLDELGLGPGEVLHLRATATDGNTVTGPGTGNSRTRQIRVVREGEEMQVDALLGFPVELEEEPVLSQRMILLLTEDLLERAPGLPETEVVREANRIARHQERLREQVGEQIFSRATGAEEPGAEHLGTGLHTHDDAVAGGQDHGHDHAARADHDPPDEVTRTQGGSRYGVASIFDLSATDTARGGTHQGAGGLFSGEGIRPPLASEAGTDVGAVTVGGLGEMPVGFGVLPELGHYHDGDPILSVNQPLLAIYNHMWESARHLHLIDPEGSIPSQEEALAGLQALRENERVFARGTVTVPPVDVDGVRGSGEVDDADPAARSPGGELPSAERWVGELSALLEDWRTPDLAGLASALLSDDGVPRQGASLVARAADRNRQGDEAGARELVREALRELQPTLRGSEDLWIQAPASPIAALHPGLSDEAGTPAVPPAAEEESQVPFVFATLRYESGNWDSGPLVPQNLIHSMAQYTELPVAPEGVVVDLASPEIFRYPLLYLTGHLPVRFSDAEARNLERYVERGGFVFMDDHNHDIDGAFHRTATAELERIFGADALEPLPNDHELYRAFFHFEDGPPTTSHELSGWGDGLIHPELHAVMVNGRIGILYSNKDYSSEWSYHAVNKRFLAVDNTRFGVNLLIYALTR